MSWMMEKPDRVQTLKLGDGVVSTDGLSGTVIEAGPYGDSPFQVRASDGRVYSFIESDGTSDCNSRVWRRT